MRLCVFDYGDAMEMSRRLAREEGILWHLFGRNHWAALNLAQGWGGEARRQYYL